MSKRLICFCSKLFSRSSYASTFQLHNTYATRRGNPNLRTENICAGLPERWKKLWFLSMKRKAEIEGEEEIIPRSNQQNWNYAAEIAAFQLRLGIKCSEDFLKVAFRDGATTQELDEKAADNVELSTAGKCFLEMFLSHYVNIVFPLLPSDARLSIQNHLLAPSTLSNVAFNLGYQDLLQTLESPPSETTLRNCFLAILEVINACEGPVSAGRFALDFVIPCLNGLDIMDDIWKPDDPMSILCRELENQSKPLPEARLVRQSGINTVTPVFNVALFSGRECLSESGGESIPLAENDAAKMALKKMYRIHLNDPAIPMGVNVDNDFLSRLFEPLTTWSEKNANEIDSPEIAASSSS